MNNTGVVGEVRMFTLQPPRVFDNPDLGAGSVDVWRLRILVICEPCVKGSVKAKGSSDVESTVAGAWELQPIMFALRHPRTRWCLAAQNFFLPEYMLYVAELRISTLQTSCILI